MAQWSTAGDGPRFALFVHHTDSEREFAYDRKSHIGTFDKALDEAQAKGWTVVDMAADWQVIWPECTARSQDDRKRVVSGTRASVRVGIGGGRISKQKKNTTIR